MKVCVMTDVHNPDDGRITKEIRTLIGAGYEVFYIAPKGAFNMPDVKYIPIDRSKSRIKRIIMDPKKVLKKAIEIDADVYHFHDPELMPVGYKLKKMGKKVVYDVHENYPEVMKLKNWIPRFIRPVLSYVIRILENFYVKRFDGAVVVTENLFERFSKFTKCVLVPNYIDTEYLNEVKPKSNYKSDRIRFFYMGLMDNKTRSIVEMIEAFKMLRENYENIELNMVGPITDKNLLKYIEENKIPDLNYIPPVSRKEVYKLAVQNDVGMMIYRPHGNSIQSSPNKMFEYMYLGLPIIASDFPYWRRILDKGPCALYVDPNDPNDIAEKMEKFIRNEELRRIMGETGKNIIKLYTWHSVKKDLLKLYKEVFNENEDYL